MYDLFPDFWGCSHRYDASASQGIVGANAPLPWLEANLEALLPAGAARCTQLPVLSGLP